MVDDELREIALEVKLGLMDDVLLATIFVPGDDGKTVNFHNRHFASQSDGMFRLRSPDDPPDGLPQACCAG